MPGETALDRVAAERSRRCGWGTAGRLAVPGAFGEPGAQHGDGAGGERCDAVLAAFAVAGDVGAGAEVDVAAVSPVSSETRSPVWTASSEHGVVAPAGPGGRVRGGEQRVDLGLGEVGDQGAVEALGRDGQDPG